MTTDTDSTADREALLQIGEFAKLAGSNLRTLRYYEELGLIHPATRSAGGFRYYRRQQLDRMSAIKRLQDLGLSLKEIASAITGEDGEAIIGRLQPALERQISLTEERMAKMEADLAELREAKKRLVEVCRGCEQFFSCETCDPCQRDGTPLPTVIRALL